MIAPQSQIATRLGRALEAVTEWAPSLFGFMDSEVDGTASAVVVLA
jgi:hypothetical protein